MARPHVTQRLALALRPVLVASLIVVASASALAQSSRREVLEAERAAKATSLQPYSPTKLEARLLLMEDRRFIQRLFDPYEGWYVHFGGLTKGAGLGGGPGYRNWVFGERARFQTWVSASLRNYWVATSELTFPKLAGGKLEVGGHGYARYFPRERFYGIGPESAKGDRTSFLRQGWEMRGDATVRPTRWFSAGGLTAFQTEQIDSGKQPGFPSIEDRFDESAAPGLAEQPDYWLSGAFVDIDYRDQRGNTRNGGHYRVSYNNWRDQQDLGFSYRDLRVEALQAFPIFDKKRVFIVRAIAQSADSPSGNVVPFYGMPTVGGSTTLRGFGEFRFRDRNAFVLNGEYRWEAFAGLDMALFADWGDVAPVWEDIDFKRLKSNYGIGFRFNTFKTVFLRFDFARSKQEGFRIISAFSGAF